MKCAFCQDQAVKTFSMLPVCNFHHKMMLRRRSQLELESKKIKVKQ